MEMTMLFPEFRTHALTLSYDDGSSYDRRMIEILNTYGLKCTFNINSSKFDQSKLDEIHDMYVDHELAVHTVNHPRLENLSPPEIAYEIIEDRKCIEKITGKIVEGMAYPYGLNGCKNEPEIAKLCGIRYARTTVATHNFCMPSDFLRWNPTCHHNDQHLDELFEKFLTSGDENNLFYLWGHSFEFDSNHNWELLEDFCRKAGGRKDIWYATNGDIEAYVTAYRQLRHSADGNMIYNPTDKELFVKVGEKNTLIKSGATVKV